MTVFLCLCLCFWRQIHPSPLQKWQPWWLLSLLTAPDNCGSRTLIEGLRLSLVVLILAPRGGSSAAIHALDVPRTSLWSLAYHLFFFSTHTSHPLMHAQPHKNDLASATAHQNRAHSLRTKTTHIHCAPKLYTLRIKTIHIHLRTETIHIHLRTETTHIHSHLNVKTHKLMHLHTLDARKQQILQTSHYFSD